MNRRQALGRMAKGGIGLGLLAGAGVAGRYSLLPPACSERLGEVDDLAIRLFDSLEGEVREQACVDYDHPLRQYHNRGVGGGGADIDLRSFSWDQRSVLTDLLHAGLSEQGRARLPSQFFINWFGVHQLRLLICGNLYQYQFRAAHQLLLTPSPEQRRAAILDRAPEQIQIEVQGSSGALPGQPIGELSPDGKTRARELVDGILSTYAGRDVAHAEQCLEANGGIDRLAVSYYRDGEADGSGGYQIFRLEGPAAVFHFQGWPHVHAFVNVAMDGERPLSVGAVVGYNPAALEGDRLRRLFERILLQETGADLAFYPGDSVVGRLRAGTIRSGDLYTLESWQNRIAPVEIPGSQIGGALGERLRGEGYPVDADRIYTVATTSHAASAEATRSLGTDLPWKKGVLIRDAAIAHLSEHGFDLGG